MPKPNNSLIKIAESYNVKVLAKKKSKDKWWTVYKTDEIIQKQIELKSGIKARI